MEASHMRKSQLDALSVIERVCSVFSLLGCVFIIGTFCASRAFHKPINRLVFYASFGNLMTNIATLMARSYVGDGNSAACQFQAFLIQMYVWILPPPRRQPRRMLTLSFLGLQVHAC